MHATPIDQPFEQWEAAWLSPSRRKKLRQQRTHFKRMGPIRLVEGASRKEVERILAAFYEQKSRRFAELGFDDPFADPPIRDFLCAAARAGLNKQSSPTMALFALEVDGIIASTLGAAVIGKTCSAMFLSHDDSLPFRAASSWRVPRCGGDPTPVRARIHAFRSRDRRSVLQGSLLRARHPIAT